MDGLPAADGAGWLAAARDGRGAVVADLPSGPARIVGTRGPCFLVLTYREHHAPNAVDNFCFDVTLSYRRLERPRRVTDDS